MQERLSRLERYNGSEVTLLQYCGRRFDWRKYCTPQPYYGHEICVIPLHSSYGQIGYTVYFPYANMPEVEYDWEKGRLTVDEENWQEYFQQS